MRNTTPDVLVVGAGPVGLTLAAELARHGASCRIIDQVATPSPYCRAIGVTLRTLEVWDDMGMVRPMIDAGLWLRGTRTFIDNAPPGYVEPDYSDLPYGHLGIPQPETERILTEHLAGYGIAVERPVTLTGFEQDSEGVRAQLVHADNSAETAAFRYIVGCDGARSTVRRSLAIPFEGDHYPVDFMLGDVILECDLPRGVMLRAIRPNQKGAPDFLVAIPLAERNRYRVSTLAPPTGLERAEMEHGLQGERGAPSIEQLQAVADRLMPAKVRMSDLRWSSIFHIGMRLAASYRENRAFIAGDAAHIHPPTGGQGMNTGIQDAYNLAWKMALVLQERASPKLLDTYDEERRPVGAEVVARTRAQSDQFGRKPSAEHERLAETQILVSYRGNSLAREEVGAATPSVSAGDRAPDCCALSRENVRAPLRLFDITRGTDHVLLLYVAQFTEPEQLELVEGLAHKLKIFRGAKCRMVAICSPGSNKFDAIGATVLKDSAGEFAAAYAPEVNTGYLIRPDGYVGYHGRPMTEQGVFGYLEALSR